MINTIKNDIKISKIQTFRKNSQPKITNKCFITLFDITRAINRPRFKIHELNNLKLPIEFGIKKIFV